MQQVTRSILFTILILLTCFVHPVKAQPGWQDFTPRYYYTILDKQGNEISFIQSKDYSIMVDSLLFHTPNIPQDSLKPVLTNTYNFDYQIKINDFSIAIPQNDIFRQIRQLEIKIIYKKDTMFICQPSGTGGINNNEYTYKSSLPSPDFTLEFIAGHYFFPNWAKSLLKNKPTTTGTVHILNIDQRHFIIPENIYDSVFIIHRKYETKQSHINAAESWVVHNFSKGHYTYERNSQNTTFDRPLAPFSKPRWSYRTEPYYPIKNNKKYLGVVTLAFDTLNWSGGRGLLVEYDKYENRMNTWSLTKNILYSSTSNLYKDTFNNIFYNKSIIRDSSCTELIYKCGFVTKYYHSKNEGEIWEEDKRLTKLYSKYAFRELEFIDQNHQLIFAHRKIKQKASKHDLTQGVYYLLKNFIVIDSFKTPDNIYYNTNYNRYDYNPKNDSLFLGNWTYNNYPEKGKSYFQPYLLKVGSKWKFHVVQKSYFGNYSKVQNEEQLVFDSFIVKNNKELVIPNQGSLILQDDLITLNKRGLILQNGTHIYLIGLELGTLFSFDGGRNWYLYPMPLEKDSRYDLIEIDAKSVITHLKNSWEINGYTFNKIWSQFLPIKID